MVHLNASTHYYGMSTHDWPGTENSTSLDSLLERQALPLCTSLGSTVACGPCVGGTRCTQELQGLCAFASHTPEPVHILRQNSHSSTLRHCFQKIGTSSNTNYKLCILNPPVCFPLNDRLLQKSFNRPPSQTLKSMDGRI